MSYEAWGTPPDPEPRYCPVCDKQSHDQDCELGKMQARAFIAEQQRDELLDELEKAANYHASHECYSEAKRVRDFIASVKSNHAS